MAKEKLKVSKNNALINASYRLSLTEMQIVLYGIGLANPTQPNFPLAYSVNIDRFAKMFDRKHGDIYKEVKNAIVRRLWNRDFSYIDKEGKTVTLRWLTKMIYQDKTGYIEIKFSEDIQPYLHNLQTNFTTYYIDQIVKFKSIYSVRFYEYALMELNEKKINRIKYKLLISDIKKQLDISDKYARFCDFKPYVLDKAKEEINKFSDLNLDYKIIKHGRAPYEIEFSVSRKEVIENQKSLIQNTKVLTKILEDAKNLAREAGTGWDIYELERQFYEFAKKKGNTKNTSGAFIGFVKKKIQKKA